VEFNKLTYLLCHLQLTTVVAHVVVSKTQSYLLTCHWVHVCPHWNVL